MMRRKRSGLTDISVLQRSDIVRSVAAHQDGEALRPQRRDDVLLLLRGDASEDLEC